MLVTGIQRTSETGQPRFISDGRPLTRHEQDQALREQALSTHQEMLDRLLLQSLVALAITAVIAIWLGWVVAGRVLRPLRSMTTAIQQITARNVHERLAAAGPRDELKDLADTVDGLLDRLETALDSHKRFVANAAHELRTPLTIEHALLEESLIDGDPTVESFRASRQQLLAVAKNQGRLLESLLLLSTSERGLEHPEPVELSELVQAAVHAFRPAAERAGLLFDAAIEPAVLQGDPVLVERLVANLIDNATHYNVRGGRVEIRAGTREGCAFLSVANTGPQIPAAKVDGLFSPFQRLDRSSDDGHHGLGLSIVRAIVTAHAAELAAQARPEGGLDVNVLFPSREEFAGASARTADRSL
jgi:signal transduction histidine kinase